MFSLFFIGSIEFRLFVRITVSLFFFPSVSGLFLLVDEEDIFWLSRLLLLYPRRFLLVATFFFPK